MSKNHTFKNSSIEICHVTPTLSRHGGGVASYIWDVAKRGKHFGLNPLVLGVNDSDTQCDILQHQENLKIKTVDRKGPSIIAYAPDLLNTITEASPDIIHAHGLRMWPIYGACKVANKKKIPFVLSMHGMMTPALLQRNKLKKKMAYALFDRYTLKNTDLIHATSIQELQHIRDYGCKNPVMISPIGCDIPELVQPQEKQNFINKFPEINGKRILLYLGLIHHKKGLLRLIKAWQKQTSSHKNWHLVLAGPDNNGHLKEVERMISETNTGNSITLTGPAFGSEKQVVFDLAQAFVVHSDWENFGIVIAEALAAGKPVLTSNQNPWEVLNEKDCGWWIPLKQEALESTLEIVLGLTPEQLETKGQNGQQLIKSQYAWLEVYKKIRASYDWLLGNDSRPECIDVI